jgi:hypothetical protein
MEKSKSKVKGSVISSGLGRDLSDLLDDNDSLPNMKSNVLLRREDGSCVKIYDKTGGEGTKKGSCSLVKKR